jgi:hypothetical protein
MSLNNLYSLSIFLAAFQKVRGKGPLANEPIARSIAGYLIKNVPDYMFNVSLMCWAHIQNKKYIFQLQMMRK